MEQIPPELMQALSALTGRTVKELPALSAIMDKVKAGQLDEGQGMIEMLQYLREHPEAETLFTQAAITELAPLRGQEASLPDLHDLATGIFRPSTHGLPRLNPLYEAALIERSQFDGDVPELRTGPLPENAIPAIPVSTKSVNPVAIGAMLTKASKKVHKEIKKHEQERLEALNALAEGNDVLAIMGKHGQLIRAEDVGQRDLAVLKHGSAATDVPAYKRGEVPASISVRSPYGATLAKMTPQQQKDHAYKFLSTTQGRMTAIKVIREIVATHLKSEGWDVVERDFDPKAKFQQPLSTYEWTINLTGAGSTQAAFSVIDVAARSLMKGLIKDKLDPRKVFLEVVPVNKLDIRVVGWAARLLSN